MITISNPDGVECGVKRITLDGELVEGDLLPLPTRKRHEVEAVMG